MSAATLFTVLDLKQAFHRLPLAEEHRALTAFTFNGQQYQFCRAPFGLTPIPNHFQRVLTTLLHDLPYVTCFIDDLTIGTGPDIEEHIKCVTTVIERLTSATVRDKISPFFGFFAMPRRELNLGLRFADETFARKLDKIIGVT
ncbi:hypothetical protein G6F62_014259 [Rhizopus arrhizus]|nr:hypothetical protein G6F62_014259 [Rhizopus arrhizus]